MSARTEWEVIVSDTIAELAAGATTVSLYGSAHPRAAQSRQKLHSDLGRLLLDQAELSFVLLGEELFVQGRPFTRTSRQAPSVIRRFRRRGVEHLTFRQGVTEDEVRTFLEELAGSSDVAVTSGPHIQVGKVELAERELGGPDTEEGRAGKRKLPTIRDRVELIHDTFVAFGSGRGLPVGDLETAARSLLDPLESQPDPLAHLAPWQGEERWQAVHAHNTCVLTVGLARLAGVGRAECVELGVAALVHDVAKVFLPADVVERELELGGSELELMLDHPRTGLEYLLATGQLPPLALIVAYEHHLNDNGTGYPRLSRPRRPHPASRLVSLADAFDVLFTARGGRGLATRETTLAWISEHAGSYFDPGWTAVFRSLLARQ